MKQKGNAHIKIICTDESTSLSVEGATHNICAMLATAIEGSESFEEIVEISLSAVRQRREKLRAN